MQATLVSVYGFDKSKDFVNLIAQCQVKVGRLLDGNFISYPLEQVHATVIGLEGSISAGSLLNDNFRDKNREPEPEDREMDPEQVITVWKSANPFTIQLGGWKDTRYGFRNLMKESPYKGSFFIRNNLVGAMGWPVKVDDHGVTFPTTLFTLRKAFETKANVLHRWHRKPDRDNDFFFRLGQTCLPDDHQLVEDARGEMRDYMAGLEPPIYLKLNPQKWTVVAYTDNKLPWEQKADNRRSQSKVTTHWLRNVY